MVILIGEIKSSRTVLADERENSIHPLNSRKRDKQTTSNIHVKFLQLLICALYHSVCWRCLAVCCECQVVYSPVHPWMSRRLTVVRKWISLFIRRELTVYLSFFLLSKYLSLPIPLTTHAQLDTNTKYTKWITHGRLCVDKLTTMFNQLQLIAQHWKHTLCSPLYHLSFTGRLSLHCLYDIRLSDSWQTLLHPRPHERRRPPLSSLTTWSLLRRAYEVLCCRSHSRPGAYAPEICCLSWPQTCQHSPRWKWTHPNIRSWTGVWLFPEETSRFGWNPRIHGSWSPCQRASIWQFSRLVFPWMYAV